MYAPIDGLEQPMHLLIGRRDRLVEPRNPALLGVDAVEHERMDVHIQIQRGAETLDDGHRSATAVARARLPRAASEEPEHRPDEDARNRAAQRVVPRQEVTQAMRQTQDPLPHGHDRKHVIDEVCGAFGHPPATAAWADGPALTGKRHEAIEPTSAAVKPGEPAGEEPAAQEVTELLLDEARQPVAILRTRRLQAECLEVIANDLVEPASGGRPRCVGGGGMAHAACVANDTPAARAADTRDNPAIVATRAGDVGGFCVLDAAGGSQNLRRRQPRSRPVDATIRPAIAPIDADARERGTASWCGCMARKRKGTRT